MNFNYLLDKIESATFKNHPFKHIFIKNFFNNPHFEEIINSPEVKIQNSSNDSQLFKLLEDQKYNIINFPGCINNSKKYIKWHKTKKKNHLINTSCEGFGITLRLNNPKNILLRKIMKFINQKDFMHLLSEKFEINLNDVYYSGGIQKYLDGYEISPHPDVRRKALTYMININPDPNSDKKNHHTHYLNFKPNYNYIYEFWNGNPKIDRCWVPWDWCETKKIQSENNSLVIFSPDDNTMHGVKTNYNHLSNQRTQIYGNLWFNQNESILGPKWEDFLIQNNNNKDLVGFEKLKSFFLKRFH
tara:strand:+ start:506 stop:1408 length:903 start_codon:yes stop_codon:yes gene_type:complete